MGKLYIKVKNDERGRINWVSVGDMRMLGESLTVLWPTLHNYEI